MARANIKIYFKAMRMEVKMRTARREMSGIKFQIALAENFEGLIAEYARLW